MEQTIRTRCPDMSRGLLRPGEGKTNLITGRKKNEEKETDPTHRYGADGCFSERAPGGRCVVLERAHGLWWRGHVLFHRLEVLLRVGLQQVVGSLISS